MLYQATENARAIGEGNRESFEALHHNRHNSVDRGKEDHVTTSNTAEAANKKSMPAGQFMDEVKNKRSAVSDLPISQL